MDRDVSRGGSEPSQRAATGALLAACSFVLGVAAPAAPPAWATQQPALTITPARVEGNAVRGQNVGPLTIRNTTPRRYQVRVLPVLVGQHADGALWVRGTPRDMAAARRMMAVSGRARFALAPGEARSVRARLRVPSARGNFYGGLMFRASAAPETQRAEIVEVLQLNGRVFLRPPAAHRRPHAEALEVRGESAPGGHLNLFARVANRGNVDLRASGTVRVRDRSGRVRFSGRLARLDVLPGYDVDLRADLGDVVLPAGSYVVDARVRAGAKLLRRRGSLELFGPNALATRRARLMSFEAPTAVDGDAAEVSATFRNTGNVTFAPRAELLVSGAKRPVPMEAESVAPGRQGKATAAVRLVGTRARELTVRLRVNGRRLDARTVSVTPVGRAGMLDRARDLIVRHAVGLVLLLTGLLLASLIGISKLILLERAQPR